MIASKAGSAKKQDTLVGLKKPPGLKAPKDTIDIGSVSQTPKGSKAKEIFDKKEEKKIPSLKQQTSA